MQHTPIFQTKNVNFSGYIFSEPDVRQDSVRYIVKDDDVRLVYMKTSLYPRFSYGENVHVYCSALKEPESFDGLRWDMYLARFGVFSQCDGAIIQRLEGVSGSTFKRMILAVKENVAHRINVLFHEPYASFMGGLLYGYRGGLGELQEQFNRTGLTHIVAISGYNIAIIAAILYALLTSLHFSRKKAFYLIIGGIVLFVIFTGASASVVRAGIMGILVLLAKQLGRASRPIYILTATATVMVAHNPLVLFWDAGFQLSFVSTIGLIYASGFTQRWFTWLPESLGIRESASATMAAIIATLPLVLSLFGRLSVVAPLVNMMVLWIIPFVMLLGFAAVAFSYVVYPAGQIMAWIAHGALTYIILVVEFFSDMSYAVVDMNFSNAAMVGVYIVFWYCWAKQKRTSHVL